MTAETAHHWPVPPQDGYTVDDLLTLSDLPPHTELIDGRLVCVGPQRYFHMMVIDHLVTCLRLCAPPEAVVVREMTVVIDRRNGPEPDVCVVRAAASQDPDPTYFLVKDVLLAVEVVSPDSESRDRDAKPHKYAIAGIPHFWRIEKDATSGAPVVHVFQLDEETGTYRAVEVFRNRLKLSAPFGIDIDLTAVPAGWPSLGDA
ncbi:Uma2 family endonuclease [Streptomyces sp. MST-110588]|uniref:Uma2 family endonuclease n=1 Tax=Streptomyces sp. MST-110588 TaxID=2833628 RepID=UPI001F5CFDB1|nr:Uma2 family endonuclease [Streptomyces sp. MST-110588]UNO40345.1 Uma2 family endonuclease [Streptomyces sp. MST-110588]